MLRTYLPNLEKLPEQAEALVGAQGFPLKISFIFSKCPTPPPPSPNIPKTSAPLAPSDRDVGISLAMGHS